MSSPPKWPLKLLKLFCRKEYHLDIEGDLLELYERRLERLGPTKARQKLWKDVILLFRPGMIQSILPDLNKSPMLKHHLQMAFRHISRDKTSFIINLTGLSVGLTAVVLILLWVQDEWQYDKFHAQDDRLYSVYQNYDRPSGANTTGRTPTPLASAMADELPEVEHAVAVNDFSQWRNSLGLLSLEEQSIEARALIASEDFFDVFSFAVVAGNSDLTMERKDLIAISDQLADKLFSSPEQALGQSLEWDHSGFKGLFQVNAVYTAPPSNSSLQFDVLFSIDHLLDNDQWSGNWTNNYARTYFVLAPGTDIDSFNPKIDQLLSSKEDKYRSSLVFAEPFSDQYLYGRFENGQVAGGRIAYVRLFLLLAGMILIIACINFMNLSTAKASIKMKEIGVKKALGASRTSLASQFLTESIILAFMGITLAVQLSYLLLPFFNRIADKDISIPLYPSFFMGLLTIGLVTGLLAGSYPALYLSGFRPITILRGKLPTLFGEVWVRKGLVIFQFSLSLLLITALLVVNDQIQFIKNKQLGYDRENVISFQFKGDVYDNWSGLRDGKSNESFYRFMEQLRNTPGIQHASTISFGNLLDKIAGQSGVSWPGQTEEEKGISFKSPVVGYDFIETMGIHLKEGRTFSPEFKDHYHRIMLNESAAELIGLEDPVGKTVRMNGGDCEIIGIVENFQHGSLYDMIEPFIFRFDINGGNVLAKIQSGTLAETLPRLEELHQESLPGRAFEYSFLDDDYLALYESEAKVATLSKYFAALAILVSCLGLFGLAVFTAERRRKEISIRKVLGASVFTIVHLLSFGFTKVVLGAVLIATPLAYWVLNNWLANFNEGINFTPYYLLVPGLSVLFISWLTVSYQTYRAAKVSPSYALQEQ
ncbi:MAG: ABC transporter permease [Saprospiraceae bacterium]|nr:ABC transporter permease [Saprospiraceae bacterium]